MTEFEVPNSQIRAGDSEDHARIRSAIDNCTGLPDQVVNRLSIDGVGGIDLVVVILLVLTIHCKIHVIIVQGISLEGCVLTGFQQDPVTAS